MGDHELAAPSSAMLKNSTYDAIRWLAQVLLPALGTAYFALDGIWGLPYVTQVVGTITVLVAFLGALMAVSKKSFDNSYQRYDGIMVPQEGPGGSVVTRLVLDEKITAEDLVNKKEVIFKGLTPEQVEQIRQDSIEPPAPS